MPRGRPVGSSASCSVSIAELESPAIVSHGAFAARCAVHGGGSSPRAVESASAAVCVVSLFSCAESTTRDGVTAITLLGGASNGDPTLQLMTSARPAREANFPCFVRIEWSHGRHFPYRATPCAWRG